MRYVLFFIFSFISGILYADPAYEVFTHEGKQGLKNESGHIVIPAEFDELGWSFTTREVKHNRIGFLKDGKWGILSVDNVILYPAELEAVYDATPNVIIAGKKQVNGRFRCGVIDYSGKNLIPYKYNFIKVYDTRLLALEGEFYGVLDFNGKIIIPFHYKNISRVGEMRWLVFNKENKGALVNSEGALLSDHIFDDLMFLNDSYALATINNGKGLIDENGNWILQPEFRDIIIQEGKAVATPYIRYSFYSSPGEDWLRDSVYAMNDNLFQHFASGKTWLTNKAGEMTFPEALKLEGSGKHLLVTTKDGTGLYDLTASTWVFDPVFQEAQIKGSVIFLKLKGESNKEWLLYDITTRRKLEGRIQDFNISDEGIAYKKNNAWGFIDLKGNKILPPVYQDIKYYKGFFHVNFHNAEGIIDKGENWIVPPTDQQIIDYNSSVYLTKASGLYNMYNYSGTRLYFSPYPLSLAESYIVEERPSGKNRIDFHGISIKSGFNKGGYEEIFPVSDGFIGIVKNGQYGFVDPQGRLRIANRYEAIQPFTDGFASIKLMGKWGVINVSEKLVVQPQYDSIGYFDDGKAIVGKQGAFGVINSSGKEIVPLEYKRIDKLDNNYFLLYKNEKVGVADENGKVLIWPKYDSIFLSNNAFIVKLNGLFGLHNGKGIAIHPPTLEKIIPIPGSDDFLFGRQEDETTVALQ